MACYKMILYSVGERRDFEQYSKQHEAAENVGTVYKVLNDNQGDKLCLGIEWECLSSNTHAMC